MTLVGGAIAVGVVYFLAARLGLALLASPSDVAVFWPAAGVAAGILITLGRRALPALVIGVVAATVAANMLSDRSLLTALLKGFCNAGEPVLAAWLLKRWVGEPFSLGSLRRVLGFLATATLTAAASAVAGAIIMTSLHTPAPFSSVWLAWFLSDGLGIVIVAPLLIACGELRFNLPSRNELVEGVGVLALLALTAVYVRSQSSASWVSVNPGVFTLPLLLWLAARCPPIFPIAGAFAISLSAIFAVTFGAGRLGDASVPLLARVYGVQGTVVMVTAYTLVLIALFAERRRSEVEIKRSAERLQLAMDAAELGAFSANLATRDFNCDARAASIHGHSASPTTLKDSRRFVHRDDLARIDAALAEAKRASGIWNVEYRVVHPPAPSRIGETRWVAVESSIVRDTKGSPTELIGVTRDITERKRAEEVLKESERRFRLTADAAPVMIWMSGIDKLCTWFNKPWLDFVGRTMERELGNGWSENVHPDDFDRCLKTYVDGFDARQTFSMEYRLRRHDGEYRWVLDNGIPLWEPAGEFAGYIGSCIDITERKQAEDHKSLLVSELDHRVKNTLACVAAIAEQTRAASNSMDEFLEVLRRRIQSLANAHALLSLNRWQGVDLAELVRAELAPCTRDGNTLIDGPDVDVTADSVQTVAIVLHELTTNAAKYGALSNDSGRISVRWHWQPNGDAHDGLVFEWSEIGGPSVMVPSTPGYGTSVIRDLIPYELGGTVDYVLAADGVRCKFEIPAKWLRKRNNQHDAFNEASQLRASS